MWTNLTGVVGAAIQKVREIESQLDNAVGVEKMAESDSANPDSLAASTINPTPFADDPQSVIREETNKKMKTKKKITTTSSSSISSMVSEVAPSNEQVQNPPIAIPRELDSQVESPHKSTTAAVPHTSIGEAKQMEELRTQMDLLRELHKQEISKLINKHESAIQTMQTQHKTEMQNCSQLQTDLREQLKGLQSDKMELHIQLQSCMENTIKKTEIDRSVTRDDTSVGTESNNRIEELQRQLQEQVQLVFRREQDVLKLEMQVQEQMQLVNEHSHSCEDARSQLTNALHALQVRESSLESLQSQLATALTDQQHIKTLFDEVAVEKQQLELALQSNNNIHNGGSNHLQQLQEQLEAYQVEGQKLAKKQSEMEKSVRQSKQQLREKELEITKLKESREQLVKVLEQTQDALKRQESEGDKAQKALQAMQAVSAASSERLVRLEQDLQISHEEQLTTRKALEHAWSELSEAKRAQQEQRGECDDLRKQLGEGASRAINTESMRREVEQREAVLRATSQQLQDQLQRSMRDAAAREDRLSEELGELRRRWQEAVSSREQLASEIASASAPLLRQIAALQEQLRVKTEQWTQVESALVERAMKSESAAEQFEHRRSLLEEQSQNFHHSLTETQARLANSQKQLVETQAANQQLQRSEARHIEDARDLQARLAQETAQVSSLQVALRDLELRHRLAITETNEAHRDNERKLSAQCDDMQKEIATLRDTLSRYKMSATNATPTASSSAPLFFTNQSSSSSFSEADVADRTSVSTVPVNCFVASERQHQQRQLREEELAALRSSVLSLTQARDALLEEVSFLSVRNAQLEDSTVSLPALRSNAQQLQQQVEVLLVLLGEKEEENESLAEDLRETKQLYRDQMNSLLSRCLILEAGAVNHKSSDTIDEDTPSNSYGYDSPHKKQITSAVSTPTLSTFQHNNHDYYSSGNYDAATSKRCTNENGKLAVWQSDTNLLELSMPTK